MSNIRVCDRCGKKLFSFDKKLFVSAGYGPFTIFNYDLCPECAEIFLKWISKDTNDNKEG